MIILENSLMLTYGQPDGFYCCNDSLARGQNVLNSKCKSDLVVMAIVVFLIIPWKSYFSRPWLFNVDFVKARALPTVKRIKAITGMGYRPLCHTFIKIFSLWTPCVKWEWHYKLLGNHDQRLSFWSISPPIHHHFSISLSRIYLVLQVYCLVHECYQSTVGLFTISFDKLYQVLPC